MTPLTDVDGVAAIGRDGTAAVAAFSRNTQGRAGLDVCMALAAASTPCGNAIDEEIRATDTSRPR